MLSNANALRLPLPDKSVQAAMLSPPYWGLRDYGVQGQLGLEATPEEYVANLVEFGREAWRVLRDDGTFWINLGDSYNSNPGNGRGGGSTLDGGKPHLSGIERGGNLPPKSLVGIPWRVALALQADGWILRNDIVWSKPNPMPESVTDRFTSSHEYVFLLAKRGRYYFDQDAVREPIKTESIKRDKAGYNAAFRGRHTMPGEKRPHSDDHYGFNHPKGRNRRTVWDIATKPYGPAHFATFPPELAEIMVLAGCPPGGLVLDPFCGSGTVGQVCRTHGRRFIGLDLNFDYLVDFAMARAERRTPERALQFGLFAQNGEPK